MQPSIIAAAAALSSLLGSTALGLGTDAAAVPTARAATKQLATAQPKLSTSQPPALLGQAGKPDQVPGLAAYQLVDIDVPAGLPNEFEFVLPVGGVDRRLAVLRTSLRSPDCSVFVDVGGGTLVAVDPPPARTYRGFVAELPEGGAAISLLEEGVAGLIDLGDGGRWYLQPAAQLIPGAPGGQHILYSSADILESGFTCGVGHIELALPDWMAADLGGPAGGDGGVAGAQPSLTEIAFDADFEFFQKNANSVINTVNDIELVMNGVDFIYDRDVNIAYEFTTFVVRSTSDDPYTTSDMGDLLCEFRSTWNSAPENAIRRDVAQLYTGKTIQGSTIGLAWLGVVCNQNGADCGSFGNLAYNSVESRFSLNLGNRQALSAHELGHNFNATHCNGASPCHIMCASLGGCDGVNGGNLKFGPTETSQIISFRNSLGCIPAAPLPLSPPFTDAFPNANIDTNKWSYVDGATTSTAALNPPSAPRVLRLNAAGAGIYQGDEIRSNEIQLGGLVNVLLSYWTQADGLEAGERLFVDYWSSGGDWININTIVASGVNQTTFTYWEHELPANARHDGFRVRFKVEANETNDNWFIDDIAVAPILDPAPPNDDCQTATLIGVGATAFSTLTATDSVQTVPGTCNEGNGTLFRKDVWYFLQAPCTGTLLVSTCGSAGFDTRLAAYSFLLGCPLVGAQPIACSDNSPGCANGTSTMSVPVQANQLYYVRLGGATGGGTGTLFVSCEPATVACPADRNGDGKVDGADLAILLASWGAGTSGDINGDGLTNAADLSILLASWGLCP